MYWHLQQVNWITLVMLFLGGFLLSGSSVIINQIIEKDLDRLMVTHHESSVANLSCFGK